MFVDPDRKTLYAFADIAAKDSGKRFIAYLKETFDDTARDLMFAREGDVSSVRKGVMQAVSKLSFMLEHASESLTATDDDGKLAVPPEHRAEDEPYKGGGNTTFVL